MIPTEMKKVKLLTSIWDHGEDHHPPDYLAFKGEILVVKEEYSNRLVVAHEGKSGRFVIYDGEYERI